MTGLGSLLWFSGRSNRRQWWLVVIVANLATFLLAEALVRWAGAGPQADAIIRLAASLPALWVIVAVSVRRRHDLGGSGKVVAGLIVLRSALAVPIVAMSALGLAPTLVPLAGGAALLLMLGLTVYLFAVLGFPAGSAEPNAYGKA